MLINQRAWFYVLKSGPASEQGLGRAGGQRQI